MSAEINGLVLAGGKSSRMGEEKGLIRYHGFPQYLFAMQLLRSFCNRVYLVCREEQQSLFSGANIIVDQKEFEGHGPISGLLSAFHYKNSSWVVLGCDYPYIEKSDLHYLVQMRQHKALATVFKSPDTGMLEPLAGIYEKNAYMPLKQWFLDGNYSLREFLQTHDTASVSPVNNNALTSVDNSEDKKRALGYFRL